MEKYSNQFLKTFDARDYMKKHVNFVHNGKKDHKFSGGQNLKIQINAVHKS